MHKIILSLIISTILISQQIHAVEQGPYPVSTIVDGNTITVTTDKGEQTVQLLYIITPNKEALSTYLKDKKVKLWGPGETLSALDHKTLQADLMIQVPTNLYRRDPETRKVIINKANLWKQFSRIIIKDGISPYIQTIKAPEKLHITLLEAQEYAQERLKGYWKTNRAWIYQHAHGKALTQETNKKIDQTADNVKSEEEAIKRHNEEFNESIKKLFSHWLHNGIRHNKTCPQFKKDEDGKPCMPNKGKACEKCAAKVTSQ